MTPRISVGLDVGSKTIKAIVAEYSSIEHKHKPKIIGIGYAESKGMRHGYVTHSDEVAPAIKQAIENAEKSSGYKVSKVYLGIGGIGLSSGIFGSSIELPQNETEITSSDTKRCIELCESDLPPAFLLNKEIIHVIPISWKVDGKSVLGKPYGMKGKKLECKALVVVAMSEHVNGLIEAISSLGIEVEDVMATPLATSLSTLSKAQQVAGVALLNIGAETVSISVFENGTPISLEIFPIGSNDITNDIALGLKISLEDAERVKLSKPESVPYPRKKLEEIITARLSDIFDLTASHLKKLGKTGLLPAGILMTGGGAIGPHMEELAKSQLKLPAKKVAIKFEGETKIEPKNGTWSPAYGLAIFGISSSDSNSPLSQFNFKFGGRVKRGLFEWIKKLLP